MTKYVTPGVFLKKPVIFFDRIEIYITFVTHFHSKESQSNLLIIKSMLSKNIRNLRESLGYTQEQIANYLNITASAISQYENDARTIPADVISKIALLFNVEEYELYQDDPRQQQLLSVFAFRANSFDTQDLISISSFKKIVLNYYYLQNALANEQKTKRT
ncbi:MAG: helix-turn-helix domain-containing protein [Fermentimonas sp.]|jgi:transcriptional regulator with XRE-family HTH domain